MVTRRQTLVGSSTLLAACTLRASPSIRTFTPEAFGAVGDGRTNDSAAFRRLAAAVNAAGQGTIVLRPVVYLVGEQVVSQDRSFSWRPLPLLELADLSGPLSIEGNGATLRCAPGLRYGTFDRTTGKPTANAQPYYERHELASPYEWMIKISRCAGTICIDSLELDGNLTALSIGGPWGDTGHQYPATGIGLYDNTGSERLNRVTCRNHPLDGLTIDGVSDRGSAVSVLIGLSCLSNGRQGCSIVGGANYRFVGCTFADTGPKPLASAPGAGVDLEAEGGKRVRCIRFEKCRFAHNYGVGLLASEGDVAEVDVMDCSFVATRSWGVWPNKPAMRFARCRFVGAITNAFGSERAEAATRFSDCTFLDDPAAADGRRVFGGENPDRPIAVLPFGRNTRFVSCTFHLTDDCVLPWSTLVVYEDCLLSQHSTKRAYPRGTFIGRNVITGNVDLNYSRIEGVVLVNGMRVLQQNLLR